MATKARRVQMKDIREGKTIYLVRYIGDCDIVDVARMRITDGLRKLTVGIRRLDDGTVEMLSYPAFLMVDDEGFPEMVIFHELHSRHVTRVKDGTLLMRVAFTTRRAAMHFVRNYNDRHISQFYPAG